MGGKTHYRTIDLGKLLWPLRLPGGFQVHSPMLDVVSHNGLKTRRIQEQVIHFNENAPEIHSTAAYAPVLPFPTSREVARS